MNVRKRVPGPGTSFFLWGPWRQRTQRDLGKEGRPLSGKQSMEEKGERNQECPTHIMPVRYKVFIFYLSSSSITAMKWIVQGELRVINFNSMSDRSDQSLSLVRLFATPWIAARQASLSIINSRSSLRLTSIESVMPSSHLILSSPSPPAPNPSQHHSLFQWVNSSHQVAKVLEFQL